MKQPSLTQLAERLGCSRPAISKAFREHRLTEGLAMVDGKLVVTSADAAEMQWRAIRQPRPSRAARAAGQAVAAEVPSYEVSRARREAALADIATAEARTVTGGQWIPRAQVDELVERFTEANRSAVRFLRAKLPMAVHRRVDLQQLARVCAQHAALTKHVCGQPLAPISDPQTVFLVAMNEVELAVDEVCTELADMFERGASGNQHTDEDEDELIATRVC